MSRCPTCDQELKPERKAQEVNEKCMIGKGPR